MLIIRTPLYPIWPLNDEGAEVLGIRHLTEGLGMDHGLKCVRITGCYIDQGGLAEAQNIRLPGENAGWNGAARYRWDRTEEGEWKTRNWGDEDETWIRNPEASVFDVRNMGGGSEKEYFDFFGHLDYDSHFALHPSPIEF